MCGRPLRFAGAGTVVGAVVAAVVCLALSGCTSPSEPEVVVYAALDREFSEPVLRSFTKEIGIVAQGKFDAESTKTVGLTQLILQETERPRCDVFWNNEILNTLRLDRQGLLAVYRPAIAEEYPEAFRSAKGTWHGFAARARVLVVNTNLVPEDERPDSIHDLTDPKWRGKAAIAKPLAGTTATHAACLFAYWGDEEAEEFFRDMKANEVNVLSGNKQVALWVAGGQLPFGLTDTDDAIIEKEKGMPIEIVYPDQGKDGIGTLFIPNTVAIIKGGPNPESARRLVDYVLSRSVEARLAGAASAQIPLNPRVDVEVRVETPRTVKPMAIDFEKAVEKWDTAAEFLRDEFAGG
jgi:iron(III) transport system substrate-binding protein